MTVPSETNRSGPYNGNGVTTVFDYEFKITNENYIRVIKADAAGVETILTIDADYIVSDVGNPAGGQVALTVPLPTGQTLTMVPKVPFTQEIDLENQGAYYAETVEGALDLSVMRDQQLQEQINRAVTIPASEDPAQLNGLVADILRLADSADEIDIVATNIAAVGTAATNIAAIIAAPAAATAAAASAAAASGSATSANTSKVNAATSETNAAASATAAAASANAAANATQALPYAFSTTVADADPGNGTFRLNNATIASATAAYIDNQDSDAVNQTGFLDAADDSSNTVRGTLTIRSKSNPAIKHVFNILGSVVDGTGYRKLALSYLSGSGVITNGMACWLIFTRSGDNAGFGAPIVILSSGQSNAALHPALAWTPAPNLYLWNHDGIVDAATHTGTAFAAMDATTMGYDYNYCNEIAKANPLSKVYLVKVGQGSQPIAQWMVGAAAPDMYACCKNNIQAALAVLGVTKIDEFLFWEVESDAIANSTTLLADYETVIARFRAETWFAATTPIVLIGGSPYVAASPQIAYYNDILRRVIGNEPDRRVYFDTAALPQTYFDPAAGSLYIHMTASGYQLLGRLAYAAAHQGTGAGRISNPWQTIVKKINEVRSSTTALSNDPELKLNVKSGKKYRFRFEIRGLITAAEDFKWGLVGPAATALDTFTTIHTTEAPTAPVFAATANAYPTAQTILATTAPHFRLSVDGFIWPSADGLLAFQWAQNTSGAGSTIVFFGSTLEFIEIA